MPAQVIGGTADRAVQGVLIALSSGSEILGSRQFIGDPPTVTGPFDLERGGWSLMVVS